MKIVVAVCVYNRFHNIQRWLECWKASNTKDAEFVIIHNHYGNVSEVAKFMGYCRANNIKYIQRNGLGYDIGCMQDVFKDRLPGFPNDWDYLLWVCDDTLPMSKDFIKPFIEKYNGGVGVTCMQISKEIMPHVRTTGFCIKKEVANKIVFPADHVTTKEHCYQFEHGANNFTVQIRSMGLSCVQVAPLKFSPLYDMGWAVRNKTVLRISHKYNRVAEHQKVFINL